MRHHPHPTISCFRLCVMALGALAITFASASMATAQSNDPRDVRMPAPRSTAAELAARDKAEKAEKAEAAAEAEKPRKPPIRALLRNQVDPVLIKNAPARAAIKYWADTTGVPLVVNWRRLENAGVNPDTLINLDMRYVPADEMLALILHQTGGDLVDLTFEVTDWYVQVLTREQALARVERKVYPVDELLFVAPNFTSAPNFDLGSALEGGGSGSGSTGNNNIFDTGNGEEVEMTIGKTHRGEELAQLIRDTIEPTIWRAHGGEHASIQYFKGRLVVTAPAFVHRQIGLGHRPTTVEDITGGVPYKAKSSVAKPDATGTGGPAAVQRYDSAPVSGVR